MVCVKVFLQFDVTISFARLGWAQHGCLDGSEVRRRVQSVSKSAGEFVPHGNAFSKHDESP